MSVAAPTLANAYASSHSSQEASNQARKSTPTESNSGSLSDESNWKAGTKKISTNDSVSNDAQNSDDRTKNNAQSAATKIAARHSFEGMVESAAQKGKLQLPDESANINEKHLTAALIVSGVAFLGVSCYTLYRAITEHNDTSLGFSIAGIVVSAGMIVCGGVGLAKQQTHR